MSERFLFAALLGLAGGAIVLMYILFLLETQL